MGSIHVVPELTITVICAVQISHGEFPEMETPKMSITVSVESPWGTSSGDSIYLPWGTHMTFNNAKGEWIVEWLWQLSY